jgi:hypothetical protein
MQSAMVQNGIDYETVLIFFVAIGVDVFLIILAKSKLVKSMWGCFGAFFVSIFSVYLFREPLFSNPDFEICIYVIMAITAAFFIAGVLLAYINVMTDAE